MSPTLSDIFREPRYLSVASRRRTRYLRLLNQRSARVSGHEPIPVIGLSPDLSTPSSPPSPASGRQRWGNFSFQAANGSVVGFPRPYLLSRAIEFTLPPSYDSLEAAKALPSPPANSQPRDRGRSFAATEGRDSHNRVVVHVRDISPVASQGSMPSYRAISPPPPQELGYYPYIVEGMELNDDDDETMRRSLHQFLSAPFSSHPDMPPCTAPACPMHPTHHNQGLYFHYGMRPGSLLQASLRHYGVNGIWDGGNPPNLVWSCLIASLNGESNFRTRAILRHYMRLHCSAESYYAPVLRRRDAQQRVIRQDRHRIVQQRRLEAEAASMPVNSRESEIYTGHAELVSRARSPVQHSQNEQESTGDQMISVQDWSRDVAAAAPDTPRPTRDLVAGPEQSVTTQGHESGDPRLNPPHGSEGDGRSSSGGDNMLGIRYTSDATTASRGEADHTLSGTGSFITNFYGEPASVIDDRRNTVLTYWSSIPETHANFLRLGLLPPTRHQSDPYSPTPTPPTLLCTSPACPIRTPHVQNTYTHPPHSSRPEPSDALRRVERERVSSFLDNVGLEGIWGDSYPDPTVFASLVRLVQDACLSPEADVGVVERFRDFHGHGNRPVVVEGEEIMGEGDLGMGQDEDEGEERDEESEG